MKKLDPRVTSGTIQCSCPKCGEPYMGQFDADEEDVVMECVSCHHTVNYCYRWPDELPAMTLRYKSSGQLISGLRAKPRRKKKKKTDVLKGQMAFEGVLTENNSQH